MKKINLVLIFCFNLLTAGPRNNVLVEKGQEPNLEQKGVLIATLTEEFKSRSARIKKILGRSNIRNFLTLFLQTVSIHDFDTNPKLYTVFEDVIETRKILKEIISLKSTMPSFTVLGIGPRRPIQPMDTQAQASSSNNSQEDEIFREIEAQGAVRRGANRIVENIRRAREATIRPNQNSTLENLFSQYQPVDSILRTPENSRSPELVESNSDNDSSVTHVSETPESQQGQFPPRIQRTSRIRIENSQVVEGDPSFFNN